LFGFAVPEDTTDSETFRVISVKLKSILKTEKICSLVVNFQNRFRLLVRYCLFTVGQLLSIYYLSLFLANNTCLFY